MTTNEDMRDEACTAVAIGRIPDDDSLVRRECVDVDITVYEHCADVDDRVSHSSNHPEEP